MNQFLIKNVRLGDENKDILIEGERVKAIEASIDGSYSQVIDGKGMTCIPGLIDMQVHFREPGFEYKETIESGSHAAAAGGFTQVAIMPNTKPCIDSVEVIQNVKERIDYSSKVEVHIIPAMTKDLAGKEICDFESYKELGIKAITDDGKGVQDDEVMERIFIEAKKYGLSILQHCEVDSISDGGSIHAGVYSERNKMKGIPSESEWRMIERDLSLLEKHGGHYHVLHVSSQKSVELVQEAKKRGLNVTCEVTPHHLFLCDEDIENANFKMNPPLRSREDMLFLQKAFLDGGIDIISTDHAPHSKDEKDKPITEAPFGVIGVETAFPLLYSYFVKEGRCSLEDVVNRMSRLPQKIFNLKGGEVKVGELADFVLIDTESILEVNEGVIASKSHNTPFFGHKLTGWPQITVKRGDVIYER